MYFDIGIYLLNTINWDNCINSIKIDQDYKVTYYTNNINDNLILMSDVLNLNIINFSNKIALLKIEKKITTDISNIPILSNLVVVYKNKNYTGNFTYLEVDEYNLTKTNFNLSINSIKIPTGYKVTCFDNIFSDNKILLTIDVPDLSISQYAFSNKISSIIVEKIIN